MATNIEMNIMQENGQYEIVYPQTITENITDIQNYYYNKDQVITLNTLQNFGLSEVNTPDDVFQLLYNKTKEWQLIQEYTQSGAYTFNWPSNNITEIIVYIIGGGGSGLATMDTNNNMGSKYYPGGDCGGFNLYYTNIKQSYSLIVGAGGPASSVSGFGATDEGRAGEQSSFNGVVAMGGNGARTTFSQYSPVYVYGENQSVPLGNSFGFPTINNIFPFQPGLQSPYGLTTSYQKIGNQQSAISINTIGNIYALFAGDLLSPFFKNKISMFARGGGGIYTVGNDWKKWEEPRHLFENGKRSSAGKIIEAINNSGTYTASKGTDYGCGGGSIMSYRGTPNKLTSAAGCDGAIIIYGR